MGDNPLPSSFDSDPQFFEESRFQKFTRRLKEEPLIPLGCAATSYALWRAYRSMKAGDSVQLNKMFRARIYAQGFTLLAVVAGGVYYKTERKQRKEFERVLDEKKNQAKRDAWLRELEVRDQEDREWRERHAAIGEGKVVPAAPKEPRDTPVARSPIENEEGRGGVVDAVKSLVWGGK
ncbi:Respiratory supercomplex factor 1, mitochondrial [Arachnomyces sp. PD_36]|nr:Respiratory supercomplex factor 1, mitochondrial [Arachnomyces sp. PD_36]